MALKHTGAHHGTFDTQIHPDIFDGRDRGLRNTCQLGELALAEFLEFTQDANRLPDRDFNPLLG